jgi:hypothetical protein
MIDSSVRGHAQVLRVPVFRGWLLVLKRRA